MITCTKNDQIWARSKNMHKLPFDYNYNDIDILKALNSANNKIGELNGIINSLPNPNIILNAVILGEVKESSGDKKKDFYRISQKHSRPTYNLA